MSATMNRPMTADRGYNPRINKGQMQQQHQQHSQNNQNMEQNYYEQQNNNDMFFQKFEQPTFNAQNRIGSAKQFKPMKPQSGLPRDKANSKGYSRAQTAQPPKNPYTGGSKFQAPLQQQADYFKKNQEIFDKEQLFEDLQHAKGIINQIKEENAHLKTRNLNMERENNKQQKLIEELQHSSQGKRITKFQNDNFLIASLKRNVKELQQEVSFKTQEIEKLKKNIKYTKFSEIEIEKKAFADETIRLRRISEQLLEENRSYESQDEKVQQLEERCFLLNNLVETLRKDNTDMANAIRILEEKAFNDQQALQQKTKSLADMKKQITQQRKQISDKDEQLRAIKRNGVSPDKKGNRQLSGGNQDYEQEEKDKRIQELEDQLLQYQQPSDKQSQQQSQNQKSPQQKQKQDTEREQLKPVVNEKDVLYYIDYVKILLQLNEFNFENLSQNMQVELPEECIKHNRASINQLKTYFQKQPFGLKNTDELELFCRYITQQEDSNSQELVKVDLNLQYTLSMIRPKLTKLLSYNLFTQDQKTDSFEYISYILKSKMEIIKQNLEDISGNNIYFVYNQLDQCFQNSQINMKKEQVDYILIKIMNFNDQKNDVNCLNKLKISDLFAAFNIQMERPNRIKRPASSKGGRRTSDQNQKPSSISPQVNKNQQQKAKKKSTDDDYGEDDDFYNYDDDEDFASGSNKNNNNNKQQQQQQQQDDNDNYDDDDFESEEQKQKKDKKEKKSKSKKSNKKSPSKTKKKQNIQDELDAYADDFEQDNNPQKKNNNNSKSKNNTDNNKNKIKQQFYDDDYGDEGIYEDDGEFDGSEDFDNHKNLKNAKYNNDYDKDLDNDDDKNLRATQQQNDDLSRDLINDQDNNVDLSDGEQYI